MRPQSKTTRERIHQLGACTRRAADYNRRMPPQSAAKTEADASLASEPKTGNASDGEYWRWCPCCGHELENQKCKFRCPRCQYFMSCSDFD